MPPIARILLVVVVVACGTAVAMIFRKDDVAGDGQPATPTKNLALQSDTPRVVTDRTRLEQPPLREGDPVHGLISLPRIASDDSTDPAAGGERFYAGNRALPPRFSPMSPLRAGSAVRGNPLRDPGTRRDLPLRDPSRPTVSASPVPAELRKHKIVDGDTLTNLAKRYLGDPRRYAEIFKINRDVLPGPHALPIGSTLRIPPRQPIPIQATGGEATTGQTSSQLRAITPGTVRPAQ